MKPIITPVRPFEQQERKEEERERESETEKQEEEVYYFQGVDLDFQSPCIT